MWCCRAPLGCGAEDPLTSRTGGNLQTGTGVLGAESTCHCLRWQLQTGTQGGHWEVPAMDGDGAPSSCGGGASWDTPALCAGRGWAKPARAGGSTSWAKPARAGGALWDVLKPLGMGTTALWSWPSLPQLQPSGRISGVQAQLLLV